MAIEGIFYVYAKVSDLERAKQFYGETLGWNLHTNEAYVAGFWFGSGCLVAGLDPGGARRAERGSGMHISVRVSDIEGEHARLAERGVDVTPVQQRPWGERNFSFKDPDGYTWEYAQPA